MLRTSLTSLVLASLALAGCPGPRANPDARDATDPNTDVVIPQRDAQDVAEDVPAFDAGPSPACAVTASARHIVDRPGGDREADPGAFVAVPGGYLAGLRRIDLSPPDGGVTDGGRVPSSRDSVDLIPLGTDGSPRGATVILADGVPTGMTVDAPLLFPTASGAFVTFQQSRGNASAPDFLLQLRSTTVDPLGAGPMHSLFRERYARPVLAALGDGNLLGVSFRFEAATDSGIVAARPFSLYLGPDGANLRPQDLDINGWISGEAFDPFMRATDDGGGMYIVRTSGHLGFLRFDAQGLLDTRGLYEVRGAALPALDDAVSAGDGVVAVWSRQVAGGRTEVHAVVASDRGLLRLDREIEAFTGEGPTAASAVRAFGGVAILWRRGVDAAARMRVAVIAPDGTVRMEPTDLVRAPNVSGRASAVANGREITFLVRDGRAPAWGYTFGRACLPSM